MPLKLDVCLWDIRDAGEHIRQFISGKTLSDYSGDLLLQFAVERCFITIGEAMVRIRDHFPNEYSQLHDAKKVIEFRNHLAHRYDAIIDDEVWLIITTSLPLLLTEVSTMIERLNP